MRGAYLIAFAVGVSGCFLDRGGTGAPEPDNDGSGFDAGGPRDGGEARFDTGTCVPTGPDLCNGLDDDCDPTTEDGSAEARFGAPCDDPVDLDLCPDGTVQCLSGVLLCAGDNGDLEEEVELCDGIDNDCNPATPDGSGDPRVGAVCDDPDDEDLCPDGLGACSVAGDFYCNTAVVLDTTEICDGVDNDCDPTTLDGSADPRVGQPCDGPDLDLCEDGTLVCVGGGLACANDGGDLPSEVELCDGVDNDCDPDTPDGSAETGLGVPCDGDDGDLCLDGVTACIDGAIRCDEDESSSSEEVCNGVDDDCDTHVDEDAGCPCSRATFGSNVYLFCNSGDDVRSWTAARDFCRTVSYELVSIADAAEQEFLATTASSNSPYWIGANDRGTEGTFRWVADNSLVTFTNWRGSQPDNFLNEDCVEMERDRTGSAGAGGWNDASCGTDNRFVCESQ